MSGSSAYTCDVSAAMNTKKKKSTEKAWPKGILEKIVGSVSKINPGPNSISMFAENTMLKMQKDARIETKVSAQITYNELESIFSLGFK